MEITQQTFAGLQHVFRARNFCLLRRLEDFLQRLFEGVLRTSWKVKTFYAEDFFETSWRQTECLMGISISKKSIFQKSTSGESKENPKSLIITQ